MRWGGTVPMEVLSRYCSGDVNHKDDCERDTLYQSEFRELAQSPCGRIGVIRIDASMCL